MTTPYEDINPIYRAPRYGVSDNLRARRQARDERDHLKHYTHAAGLCGPYASCCPDCDMDALAETCDHLDRYRELWQQGPNEDAQSWYIRLGGRYCDIWPTAVAYLEGIPYALDAVANARTYLRQLDRHLQTA